VIIDDVCSTGGTLRALISALWQVGADIADICVVISRGNADIGRPLKTLVRVDISGGRVRVVDTCL
jgi:adenine phosphoribosyltransferase